MNLIKRIFIINGSGGQGKDTFVKLCSNHFKVTNTSKIIPAKKALCELLGISMEKLESNKTEEIRALLVHLNQIAIKNGDYPSAFIMKEVADFVCSTEKQIMFIHIREPEEIDKIKNKISSMYDKSKCVVKTILVSSTRVKKITSNTADANVDNYDYDIYIDNSSNKNRLMQTVDSFCNGLQNEYIKEGEDMNCDNKIGPELTEEQNVENLDKCLLCPNCKNVDGVWTCTTKSNGGDCNEHIKNKS